MSWNIFNRTPKSVKQNSTPVEVTPEEAQVQIAEAERKAHDAVIAAEEAKKRVVVAKKTFAEAAGRKAQKRAETMGANLDELYAMFEEFLSKKAEEDKVDTTSIPEGATRAERGRLLEELYIKSRDASLQVATDQETEVRTLEVEIQNIQSAITRISEGGKQQAQAEVAQF